MADNYKVELLSEDYSTTTLLTDEDVISIDRAGFSDITTASQLHIRLNCRNGKFLTTAPLILDWHKIKVTFTDPSGNSISRIYEVQTKIKSDDEDGATAIFIGLSRDYHLTQLKFGGTFLQTNSFEIVKELIAQYNTNKGSLQVLITKHDNVLYNKLPKSTYYNYEFTTTEIPYKDGMTVILNTTNLPVGGGGFGDYFAMVFEDDPDNDQQMILNAFIIGSKPTADADIPVFEKTLTSAIESIVAEQTVPEGTIVYLKGDPQSGSLPIEFAKFRDRLQIYSLLPEWINGIEYKKGQLASYNKKKYRVTADTTTNAPTGGDWEEISITDYVGNLDPSPWTMDKAGPFKNMMGNSESVAAYPSFESLMMWDANLVLRTPAIWRDWADVLASNPANASEYQKDGQFPQGFRILCIGVGTSFGFPLQLRTIYEWHGSRWRIYRELLHGTIDPEGTTRTQGDECAVLELGKVYKYFEKDGITTVQDFSDQPLGNDCFHPINIVTSDDGIYSKIPKSGGGTYGTKSAIRINTQYVIPPLSWTPISGTYASYYAYGLWIPLFIAPYPNNTKNNIQESVGALYKPDALSIQNLKYTHGGKTSFVHKESEDFLELRTLSMGFKLDWFRKSPDDTSPISVNAANIKMSAYAYNYTGGVAKTAVDIPITGSYVPLDIALPPSAYASIDPKRTGEQVLSPKEAADTTFFESHNIKMIGLQIEEVYDEYGRYSPFSFVDLAIIGRNRFTGGDLRYGNILDTITLIAYIDALRFTKQLLVISGDVSKRRIQGRPIKDPSLINYAQGEAYIGAQKEIVQHPYDEYTITGPGRCDISIGQSIYVKSELLVSESDKAGETNIVKLAVTNVEQKYNAGGNGKGHQTVITAIKRISVA